MTHHYCQPIEILESRIAPASLVDVTYTLATGVLELAGDAAAANNVNIFKTGTNSYRIENAGGTDIDVVGQTFMDIGKVTSIKITGGAANDTFGLTNLNTLQTLTFQGDDGYDTLTLTNVATKGLAKIEFGLGGGSASFDGTSTTIGGDLTVNYGDGGNVTLDAIRTTIKGAVTLTGATGDDNFTLAGSIATVGKGIKFTGDAGVDSIDINSTSAVVGKAALSGNAVEFDAGSGDDSLRSAGGLVSLKGNVVFAGGDDTNMLTLVADTLKVDGELKVTVANLTVGADANFVALQAANLMAKKAATIALGDGGAFSINGREATLGSSVMITGGSGDESVSIQPTKLTIGGALSFGGLSGLDTFDLQVLLLSIKGATTITGGDNADTVSIRADGSIKGDVNIDLGASDDADQDITLAGFSGFAGSLKLGGKLTATSLATDSGMLGLSDSFSATDVSVAKAALINLGDRDSVVTMDNFSTKDTFTLNTLDGNDKVNIEQNNLFGPSIMSKVVTIDLGDGDDLINIGKSSAPGSSAFVKFFGSLTVEGGIGSDTRNNFGLNSINVFVPPATSNPGIFETVT